jgi:hypothetical protein
VLEHESGQTSALDVALPVPDIWGSCVLLARPPPNARARRITLGQGSARLIWSAARGS